MEKFILKSAIWTLICFLFVGAADNNSTLSDQIRILSDELNTLKNIQNMEIAALKEEIADLK